MMKPYYETKLGKLFNGESLQILSELKANSVQCCITSPPYWGLRSYLPNRVSLKEDAPGWVIEELEKLGIFSIDNTEG